jgi:F0F1-type ATP synthase membrane subunit c/vacuolar-type H+-ATPase subunit K
MHREPGFHRFFMVMSLFIGSMQLLALGGNVAITFLGWELAGVCSYLLIAYAHDRPVAADNATRVFITTRIGDAAFILGLVLSFLWAHDLEWPALIRSMATLDTLHPTALTLCFLVAAMAKSAQIPFTPWIGRALEGPTPASGVFYGSLLVHAGVFLILKLQPLIEPLPGIMLLLAVIGAGTALYGYFCGLTQFDVRSALMFSTVAQIGLMFLACGLGWWTVATVHLFCHAIVQLHQFLNAPSLMHRTLGQPMRPVMGRVARRRSLHVASLRRLWLEPLLARWSVQPVDRLAADLCRFDRNVIEKAVGLPVPTVSALSSLAAWEEHRLAADTGPGPDQREVSGLLGYLAHHFAAGLHWFEEKLVLQGVGNDLRRAGRRVGYSLAAFEQVLRKPRYLLLIVLITLLCTS